MVFEINDTFGLIRLNSHQSVVYKSLNDKDGITNFIWIRGVVTERSGVKAQPNDEYFKLIWENSLFHCVNLFSLISLISQCVHMHMDVYNYFVFFE